MPETLTCAAESRLLQEPLAGTFKPADVFFLIESHQREYGGWQSDIVKEVGRSGDFAPYIQHLLTVARAKILFIRRPRSEAKNFYIAMTSQPTPKIWHTSLSDYADLLGLDLASLAAGGVPRLQGRDMDAIDELYAVCTNGRHDPCCAAHGLPMYQAMADCAGTDKVWQTTHIGGHRMAATLLAFPHGIAYGHLDLVHAAELAASHRAGNLLLDKYRGRGAYANHNLDVDTHCAVGAAEAYVRRMTKNIGLDDLDLAGIKPLAEKQWQVTFADREGNMHQAQVSAALSAPRLASCHEAPKPMPRHQVLAYAAV